jgi:Uma2 family endonuclease
MLTYEDYVALPNDSWRDEIHDGELSVTPTPTGRLRYSPPTARNDRGKKKELFERYGVAFYWMVDHDARAIEIYRAESGVFRLADRRTDDLADLPWGETRKGGEAAKPPLEFT